MNYINNMKRDRFWDSLKFILIFFVVYGHMIETYTPDGSFNRAMYNFIYTFHMPFFMFISGRFSQIKDRKKYLNGIILILETYIVFQIIRCKNLSQQEELFPYPILFPQKERYGIQLIQLFIVLSCILYHINTETDIPL